MKTFQRIYLSSIMVVFSILLLSQVFIQVSSKVQDEKFVLKRRVIIFRVDASFSDGERDAIWRALKSWEQATNNYVELNYYVEDIPFTEAFRWKEDGVITIYNAAPFFSWQRHIGSYDISYDALGVTYLFVGDIFILRSGDTFEKVVTHEVGHVLAGAWHSDDADSIMFPYTSNITQLRIMKEEVGRIRQRILIR